MFKQIQSQLFLQKPLNILSTLKEVQTTKHSAETVAVCGVQMSLEGVPLLLRPGRGKADLLCGCVRRLVRLVKGSINELLSVTVTSQSLTFSPRAHCWAASWSTCRRSRRSHLFPNTITITCTCKYSECENIFTGYTRSLQIIMGQSHENMAKSYFAPKSKELFRDIIFMEIISILKEIQK